MAESTLVFNVSGAERKRLVNAIGEIAGVKAQYLGMPSAAYRADRFTIDRNGTVSFDGEAGGEAMAALARKLAEQGFIPGPSENTATGERNPDTGEQLADGGDVTGFRITIPIEKVSVGNLTKLLEAKGGLIRKAFGIPATPVEVGGDSVSFPWFDAMPDPDEVGAYTRFIAALCDLSGNLRRVNATEKEIGNDKYSFRCFLLRLGFIGEAYKKERKILLRNLTGSSAFKGGANDDVSE